MSQPVDILAVYLHLAKASQQRQRPHVRDKLLVISGSIAARMEWKKIDIYCRYEILQHNPGHMVRRWPSFVVALEDSDFLHLLKQQQRRYPFEKAEQMLVDLGIEPEQARAMHDSDEEYLAALLDISLPALNAWFDQVESE